MQLPETPRYSLEDPDDIICPWCQCKNILSESALYDDEHFECLHCGKSYNYVVDKKGGVFIEGLNTDADQKYLDWVNHRNSLRLLASMAGIDGAANGCKP